jgi:hypothetical protein
MKYRKILIILILMIGTVALSKPRVSFSPYPPIGKLNPNAVVIQRVILNANNISAYFQNTGIFDQNTTSGNLAGLEWPKGSGKTACFTAGLSIGCYKWSENSQGRKLAQVMASYKGEWVPGAIKMVGGKPTLDNDPKFKMYSVKTGDNETTNPDYANWGLMVPYGAPYQDINQNGQYDPGIDIPGRQYAAQTIFECMTDADPTNRSSGEGFGGGVQDPLLYAEVHWTMWAYTTPGLEDMQFIDYKIINKGDSAWYRTYMGIVVDPDLGDSNDDYIGCDTTFNLGYCYNADNDDLMYGTAPPAFGMDYFRSPVIRSINDTLGLTSFTFFTNTGSSPPPCESDPNGEPVGAYLMLQGVKKDSTSYMDVTQNPYKRTKFCYYGDPETGTGWTEYKGSIPNCGGDTTGTLVAPNPPGDRRFIFSSGREDFIMNPGDTQNIVLAQFVARGSNNKNSVTKLRQIGKTAKIIFDQNFNVTPPPPQPKVDVAITPLANGLCNITLNWDDAAEKYVYWDTIFFPPSAQNIYKFQGYEVYEINKYAKTIPDFTKPETITNDVQLIDIFDKRDGIGTIIDTFSTGVSIGGNEVFAPFPIVPPYKMAKPANFPDHGISRSITLTTTKFPENYGGKTSFIYGQEYYFAVVAYAYSASDSIRRGFKVIRNSLGSSITVVKPIAPPAGTIYTYKNGDTLDVSFPIRDLGLAPIVRNADILKNAVYRVVFNPDTTYNILRKLEGNSYFDTLKTNLKFVPFKSSTDDSSRTLDGIFFNLQKIRYTFSGSPGDYLGNVGVLKDPGNLGSDSIQTRRFGWEWSPPERQSYTGAKVLVNNQDPVWQSKSMSISYPTKYTYNKVQSKLTPDKLRTVKIIFTGGDTVAGQNAYRYVAISNNNYQYQDVRKVPLTVWEIDPYDSSAAPRQLNCAFLERRDSLYQDDGQWNPSVDSTGGYNILYIFNSNYGDPNWDAYYKTRNLYVSTTIDIMYIWAPRAVAGVSPQNGDYMIIYPYYNTRPYFDPNNPVTPFFYEFTTKAPIFGDKNTAKNQNALDRIKVVPNPYYGFSTLDRGSVDKFVTFRNLPLECTIKIYTLNGDLIRVLEKKNTGNPSNNSTLEWNLQNFDRVPVASGIYIALIDAPGIGQKTIKIVVFTAQERINF